MADLSFDCLDAQPVRYSAAPTLQFRLRVAETSAASIHAIALRCQIRIEPQHRQYTEDEGELLGTLFGDRSRWAQTLKPLQFAQVSTMVPSFTGSTEFDLPVPCSYDLEVAAGSYFHALSGGVVPLLLLFSGTVFGKGGQGFWVEPVPWRAEATYRMPVSVWRELMDLYFPASGWLRLHRETLDALQRYKSAGAIATWDEAIGKLLAAAGAAGP